MAQWRRLRESGNLNTAGQCGAAYIFGCRKFSAPLVNGQNDSSRHIICLADILYSSYLSNSRNRFSPNTHTHTHTHTYIGENRCFCFVK